MILTCGVRGEPETEDHPVFVCHHCGMPVCEQHGWVVSADGAFFDPPESRDNAAKKEGKAGPRAAMHCPGCLDKYHSRVLDKRHGWADRRRARLNPRAQEAAAPGDSPAKKRSPEERPAEKRPAEKKPPEKRPPESGSPAT